MKAGYLSQHFKGVAVKSLSAVEVKPSQSNQHEFNGVTALRSVLGNPGEPCTFPAQFIYLTDYIEEPLRDEGFLTWYDARRNVSHRSAEGRLYFPSNQALQAASEGDTLVLAVLHDDRLLAVVIEHGTTIEQQVLWLFGFSEKAYPKISIREELETEQHRIAFASRVILEAIGIESQEPEDTFLDEMLSRFNGKFPSTMVFSEYAVSTLADVDAQDGPDDVLLARYEREEILFRTLERHLVGETLSNVGKIDDVDWFIKFSLSVQNRRKSRAGRALENHLELIFQELGIRYSRGALTENKAKPDFLFPSGEEYHDESFNASLLTMLGVKSTCKERWRQVLSEAARIDQKHLLTLEPAISENQTSEMKAHHLNLVVPVQIQATFKPSQQAWLLNLSEFIEVVKSRDLPPVT